MQPLGFQSLREAHLISEDFYPSEKSSETAPSQSWFARTEAHAERAARIGFVLSMVFFGVAAAYGVALSGTVRPYLENVVKLADHVAYKAGFRIESLSMSGSENAPSKLILDTLRLPYTGSILSYDTAQARDRLIKLGWIETAEVRRILPSSLEIALTERKPFARLASGNDIVLIDRQGHILGGDENNKFGNLLLLSGDDAASEAAAFSDVLKGHDTLRTKIERADLVAERFWSIKLVNGLIAKLPRKLTVLCLNRLDALLASNKIAEMALDTIDLRLPHRTILQLQEPTIANRDKAIASLTLSTAAAPHKGKPL